MGEPLAGHLGDGVERARFLEEMRRAGDDLDAVLAQQLAYGVAVELEHDVVAGTDDQQRRGACLAETGCGQVGPAATRHHRADACRWMAGGPQRGGRAGAGTEVADGELGDS